MFKVPYYPVAHPQTEFREDGVQNGVEWDDRPVVNVVANLPANAAVTRKTSDAFPNDLGLLAEVCLDLQSFLVFLPDVVGGGSDDEMERFIGAGTEKVNAIARKNHNPSLVVKPV
jgi:hypothetical protein